MTQETVSFAEIVSQLTAICTEHRSGTLFVTSHVNRSAQIVVENGNIVFLYYFNKRGQDALKLLPEIESGRYKFQEGSVPSMRTPSLVTDEILQYLSAASGQSGQQNATAVATGSNPAEQKSAAHGQLSAEQKQILEEGLAIYIGPMASFICEDHLEKAGDVQTAIERLAAEIPEAAQARSFSAEMSQRLIG